MKAAAQLQLSSIVALLCLQAIFPKPCTNDANFTFEIRKGKERNCFWVGMKKSRQNKYCASVINGSVIRVACKASCDFCPDLDTTICANDGKFTFKISNGKERTCHWIGMLKSRQDKYCERVIDGVKIREACQASCDFCQDVLTAPSPAPSTKDLLPTPNLKDSWSFIILADWHKADYFATNRKKTTEYYKETFDQINYVNERFGGELVLLPGDTNGALPSESGGGKWDTKKFAKEFKPKLSINGRVEIAGRNCYKSVTDLFKAAGYDRILVALGDHEIGGNSWAAQDISKLNALPAYHSSFTKWYNKGSSGEFYFQDFIGSTPSRPVGTEFIDTSYAYQHNNVLFITVDAFKQLSTTFIDRKEGLGGEGTITCTVEGEHLEWFENVLIEATKDDSIKHIIVQSHPPIIQPVRKVACSGQFMDYGEHSAFWKAMVKYGVDIYLAGEVHANTVTKDPGSSLLQIVSRGNQFSNFLKVEVTDSSLNITAYNQFGTKRMNNKNYTLHGSLVLDKSDYTPNPPSGSPKPGCDSEISGDHSMISEYPKNETTASSPGCPRITASGVLELLDRTSALVHFDFEEIIPLGNREVIGLLHDDHLNTMVVKSITIRGIKSNESLRNLGTFGQQYDGQVANLNVLRQNELSLGDSSYYGAFTENSRLAIFANAPHSASTIISYALWIKTAETSAERSEMILVHYGHNYPFAKNSRKNIFTLTLRDGTPTLYSSRTEQLIPRESYNLNDDKWHHIAVSMPNQNCRLSDVIIYIDGTAVETIPSKKDRNIFFTTSGRMSIGGFGYSNDLFDSFFSHLSTFVGGVDGFFMWARTIRETDFLEMGLKDNLSSSSVTTNSTI